VARKRRIDAPGMFHHVMNRGVEKRTIFERPDDYRFFKVLLACAVRAGRIRLHGFALMPNHYHLIVESLDGRIGETMRRIQALYAGRFNRTRTILRPGHLFGARFKSFPIRDDVYLFTAVGYVDLNPVKAGLCRAPWHYPHGSARSLLVAASPPPWLCPWTMNRLVAGLTSAERTTESIRAALYSHADTQGALDVVSACIEGPAPTGDWDLVGLLGGSHAARRAWAEREAARATRTRPAAPLADVASVQATVGESRLQAPDARVGPRRSLSLWTVLEAGLLRDLAAMDARRVGEITGVSRSTAMDRWKLHRECIRDAAYANIAAVTIKRALERCYGAHAIAIATAAASRRVSPQPDKST
jgi:REP element-mobilizing transposase RayT